MQKLILQGIYTSHKNLFTKSIYIYRYEIRHKYKFQILGAFRLFIECNIEW